MFDRKVFSEVKALTELDATVNYSESMRANSALRLVMQGEIVKLTTEHKCKESIAWGNS